MLLADLAFSEPLCVDALCAVPHEVKEVIFLFSFFHIKALLQSSASRKTQKKKKKKVSDSDSVFYEVNKITGSKCFL